MGRPAKYTTEEEKRKARCEAVKRYNEKNKKEKIEKEIPPRNPRGRPKLHNTEEEKRVAKCEASRKYYETNYNMISAQRKQYYQDNKEKIKSRVKYQMKKPENLTEMINFLNELWKKRPINTRSYVADKDVREDLKDTYEEIKENYNDVPFTLQQFYEAYNQLEFYTLENASDKEFMPKYKKFYTREFITEHTAVYYFVFFIMINQFNRQVIDIIRQRIITH